MYDAEISSTLISTVTDAIYPVVYLDCIHIKVSEVGAVRAQAVCFAIGINIDSEKEVLSLWIAQTEGGRY